MSENAKQKIETVISEIEDYVSKSNRIPLLDRVAVRDDELFHFLDKIRSEIPREVDDAMEVCHRREEIIGAAQTEAEQIRSKAEKEAEEIMEKAREFAQKTVDDNTLKQQAEEQARAVVEEAEARAAAVKAEMEVQAEKLKADTEAYVLQLRADAEHYADQMFEHVIANMTAAVNAVNTDMGGVLQAMQQAKEQLHAANQGE